MLMEQSLLHQTQQQEVSPSTYTICEVSNPTNCTVTSNVTVTAPVIAAVTETTAAINETQEVQHPLITNDTLNGLSYRNSSRNVTMTTGTLPAGITVNTATGIVTVAPNTPVEAIQSVTPFEVNNPTNCSTVTSNIVVSLRQYIRCNR
jgi:hypothetical protein